MKRFLDRLRWRIAKRIAPPISTHIITLTPDMGARAVLMVRDGDRVTNAFEETWTVDRPAVITHINITGRSS